MKNGKFEIGDEVGNYNNTSKYFVISVKECTCKVQVAYIKGNSSIYDVSIKNDEASVFLIRDCRDIRMNDWIITTKHITTLYPKNKIVKALKFHNEFVYPSCNGKGHSHQTADFRRATPTEVANVGLEWDEPVKPWSLGSYIVWHENTYKASPPIGTISKIQEVTASGYVCVENYDKEFGRDSPRARDCEWFATFEKAKEFSNTLCNKIVKIIEKEETIMKDLKKPVTQLEKKAAKAAKEAAIKLAIDNKQQEYDDYFRQFIVRHENILRLQKELTKLQELETTDRQKLSISDSQMADLF